MLRQRNQQSAGIHFHVREGIIDVGCGKEGDVVEVRMEDVDRLALH